MALAMRSHAEAAGRALDERGLVRRAEEPREEDSDKWSPESLMCCTSTSPRSIEMFCAAKSNFFDMVGTMMKGNDSLSQ